MEEIQKKKILVTASTFPRWEGDTEPRFILDYAQAMTKYYDVTVLAPAAIGAKDEEYIGDVKVIRYHYFPIHKWETLCYPGAIVPRIKQKKVRVLLVLPLLYSLRKKIKKISSQYDMVHAHWLIPQGIMMAGLKVPYILTGHGGDISSLNIGIVKKWKLRCMEQARAVVVVSKYKQEELQVFYPEIKSTIISMGVNLSLFNRDINYKSDFFHQGDKKVILFVGRLAEIKGVNYLIDAMKYLENVKLIIVGDGPEKENLYQQAKNISDEIVFMGSKSHEQLKTIYSSADILVVPSIIDSKGAQEGLPTVIMEAFASKIPVVATSTGGVPDVIKNNITGMLVNEKSTQEIVDAIKKLLSDKSLYESIVNEAYKYAKKCDYEVVATKYHQLIERLDI